MNRSKKSRRVATRPRVTRDLMIRPATSSDLKALVRLAAEVNEPTLTTTVLKRELFERPAIVAALVAELDGSVVAAAFHVPTFDVPSGKRGLFLPALLIGAAARARDVGRVLIAGCVALAKNTGGHFVHWDSGAWNVDAHDFYRKAGAAEVPIMAHSVDGVKFTKLAKEGAKYLLSVRS
jgi:GNAT superfamily N-acetyltransferase